MATLSKKIIAVIGATGRQGSSVAHTFLTLPGWHVRCLTRDPSSPAARTLAAQGAEVVAANLADQASLERAFAGAHAIFLNTDFWGPYRAAIAAGIPRDEASRIGYEDEITHGNNAAAAAAAAARDTLERLVYSALGPMAAASGGKYTHSNHWETKAVIATHILGDEHPQLAARTSLIYMGGYATNQFLRPRRVSGTRTAEDATYEMAGPSGGATRFPIIDEMVSTGMFVRALVEDEPAGTKLLAYDSYITLGEAMGAWSRATGREVVIREMSLVELQRVTGLPFEILDGLGFLSEFDYTAGINGVIGPAQLKKRVQTVPYEDWLMGRDMKELLADWKTY